MKIQKAGCKNAQMKRKLLMTALHNSELFTEFHLYYYYDAQLLFCQGTWPGNTETMKILLLGFMLNQWNLIKVDLIRLLSACYITLKFLFR